MIYLNSIITIIIFINKEILNNMDRKKLLIKDVQTLLNNYDDSNSTIINPSLLEFMDEDTLIKIIGDLLSQKEAAKESDIEWLQKFKKIE